MEKVRFYFSFRSPFAAIAFYRLRRAPQFNGVEFELIPTWPDIIFGGHMDNPTDNLFKMAYIFHDAARQAAAAGLDPAPLKALAERYRLPDSGDYRSRKVGVEVGQENWHIPHCAFLYAQSQGKGWAFGDAVFARRFNFDGQGAANVMNPRVIKELAEGLGLDGDLAAGAHESKACQAALPSIISHSERDGVFGVPFFVRQTGAEEKFWGNDRIEFLLRSLQASPDLPNITIASLATIQPGRD